MYATGISQGLGHTGDEYLEALDISFWVDAKNLQIWRQGLLRDIYPWNFVTPAHLERTIDGVTLEQWIGQKPDRGQLSVVESGVVLWKVPDVNLPEIRLALQRSGAIFDWTVHLEGADEHPAAEAARLRRGRFR